MYPRQLLLLSLMASLLLVLDLNVVSAATTASSADTTAAGDAAGTAGAGLVTQGGVVVGVEGGATTAGSDAAAPVTSGGTPADSATEAPSGSDATVGSATDASATQGAGVPADATEGATGQQEAVTQAAGGATVARADGTTAGGQVATQAAGEVVTSGKTQEADVTTGAAAVVPPAGDATKPPPEATYKVTTIPVNPYLIVHGEDKGYTGFVIDVLDKLKEIMNVEFDLQVVKDGKYGKQEGDEWTGMIGEVVRGEADLAAAPLTVTVDREDAVDFTYPFISYSAAVVFMKRTGYSHPLTASLEDLVNEGYKFGVTAGSNIYKVLENTKKPLYRKILESIDSNDGLTKNNNEGVKQVRKDSKYAFLMESTSADWIAHQEPCDLEVIKTEIYKRKYAFAVNNLSDLRDKLNRAIIELQDQGTLEELQDKWFKPQSDCSGCGSVSSSLVNLMAIVSSSVLYLFWA